jgi:rhodanese-related sulfurtransferase
MPAHVTTFVSRFDRRHFLRLAGAGLVAALGARLLPANAQNTAPVNFDILDAQTAYDTAESGDIILVDIRRLDEWAETGIGEGAVALDMREENFVTTLISLRRANPDTPIALICRTGNRSNHVVSTLAAQNFPGLVDVSEVWLAGAMGRAGSPVVCRPIRQPSLRSAAGSMKLLAVKACLPPAFGFFGPVVIGLAEKCAHLILFAIDKAAVDDKWKNPQKQDR